MARPAYILDFYVAGAVKSLRTIGDVAVMARRKRRRCVIRRHGR